jgi:hypothetical protein
MTGVAEPVGRWWLTYDDGAVWPVEVTGPAIAGHWRVVPQAPAPDAGEARIEPAGRVYDSRFNHPRMEETA